MSSVYRIDTIPSQTNEFGVGRVETWTLKLDTRFTRTEEAKEYVRNKNRQHSDLPLFLPELSEEAKEAFVDIFCFSDTEYLHLRRYFLGMPDQGEVMAAVRNQGIQVIKVK